MKTDHQLCRKIQLALKKMIMDSVHIIFKSSYVIVMSGSINVLYVNSYWQHWWFYPVKMWMTSGYYFVVHNFIQLTYSLKPLCMYVLY